MAQPTQYVRQYSFRAFQTANPDDPLPGDKVDIELNAVKVTLDEIRTNLALIQRDDGKLGSSSVGVDQLVGTLISLAFDRPTNWATATAYKVNAAVFQSNKLYVCLVAHTSGTFATDLAAAKWVQSIDFTTIVTDAQAARDLASTYASNANASAIAAAASAAVALPLAGGTMTGAIVTSGDATLATQAPRLSQIQSAAAAHSSAVAGTVDAITVAHSPVRTAIPVGARGTFTATGANTITNPTVTFDGIGPFTIVKENLAALAVGDIAGVGHEVEWVCNGASTVVLLNPKAISIALFPQLASANVFTNTQEIESTDAGAGEGPTLNLDRNSASPASSDVLGSIPFLGRSSTAVQRAYARIRASITTATNAAEDGLLGLRTMMAGTEADRVLIGAGLYTAGATGGDKGANTINASAFYKQGVLAEQKTLLATLTTTSGTTHSVTSIPSTYRSLEIEIEGVSFTSTNTLALAVSGDNGSNYGTATAIAAALANATDVVCGVVRLMGIRITGLQTSCFGTVATDRTGGNITNAITSFPKHATGAANAVDAIRFSGGTFDAGTIRVYGVP